MRALVILTLCLALAGCGGNRGGGTDRGPALRAASGPVSGACLASDRRARSPALCGCIQAAANQTLGGADQRLAASFFADPQKAQDIRMSKRPRDDAFWDRYINFTETAAAYCG